MLSTTLIWLFLKFGLKEIAGPAYLQIYILIDSSKIRAPTRMLHIWSFLKIGIRPCSCLINIPIVVFTCWSSKQGNCRIITVQEQWFSTILLKDIELCYCWTRETVFHHIYKHQESWKHNAQQSILDKLWGVWMCGKTLSQVYDTSCQSKQRL